MHSARPWLLALLTVVALLPASGEQEDHLKGHMWLSIHPPATGVPAVRTLQPRGIAVFAVGVTAQRDALRTIASAKAAFPGPLHATLLTDKEGLARTWACCGADGVVDRAVDLFAWLDRRDSDRGASDEARRLKTKPKPRRSRNPVHHAGAGEPSTPTSSASTTKAQPRGQLYSGHGDPSAARKPGGRAKPTMARHPEHGHRTSGSKPGVDRGDFVMPGTAHKKLRRLRMGKQQAFRAALALYRHVVIFDSDTFHCDGVALSVMFERLASGHDLVAVSPARNSPSRSNYLPCLHEMQRFTNVTSPPEEINTGVMAMGWGSFADFTVDPTNSNSSYRPTAAVLLDRWQYWYNYMPETKCHSIQDQKAFRFAVTEAEAPRYPELYHHGKLRVSRVWQEDKAQMKLPPSLMPFNCRARSEDDNKRRQPEQAHCLDSRYRHCSILHGHLLSSRNLRRGWCPDMRPPRPKHAYSAQLGTYRRKRKRTQSTSSSATKTKARTSQEARRRTSSFHTEAKSVTGAAGMARAGKAKLIEVFLHIPKTAGNSVRQVFVPWLLQQQQLQQQQGQVKGFGAKKMYPGLLHMDNAAEALTDDEAMAKLRRRSVIVGSFATSACEWLHDTTADRRPAGAGVDPTCDVRKHGRSSKQALGVPIFPTAEDAERGQDKATRCGLFTMLRHPISRMVSELNYCEETGWFKDQTCSGTEGASALRDLVHSTMATAGKGAALVEYAKVRGNVLLEHVAAPLAKADWMVPSETGGATVFKWHSAPKETRITPIQRRRERQGPVNRADVEVALSLLETRYWAFGITEKFQESITRFAKVLAPRATFDLRSLAKGKSAHTHDSSNFKKVGNDTRVSQEDLSPAQNAELTRVLALDLMFYARAAQLFNYTTGGGTQPSGTTYLR